MRGSLWTGLVILVGCGEVRNTTPDAAIDAPVDTAVDGPTLPVTHHRYVIDRFLLPATNTQARDFGLDLDGDAEVDNQLGMVMSTLGNMGLDIQIDTDKQIDTGTTIMLPDLGADDLTTETYATFTIFQGANPTPAPCFNAQDTVCRKHLTGSGAFTAKTAPVDPPLVGTIDNGKLVAGPGHLTVQFSMLSSTPLLVSLLGARVELMPTGTAIGKIGGAIGKPELDNVVIPGMREGFQAAVARDCTNPTSPPGCGCVADSQGKTYLGLFDTDPQDCSLSVSEIRNNSLIVSLFAPDVTIEGLQALSLGVSVHAVGASYISP
jgi:hypothetical protein